MKKTGRNEPCPCGSGRKYKHCCLAQDRARPAQPREQPAAVLEALQRAVQLGQAGRLAEAEALYRQVLAIGPRLAAPDLAGVHYNLGNVLRDQRKMDEAVASYRRALEIRPRSVEICGNLAGALMESGRLEEAVGVFRTALAIAPGEALLQFKLGSVLQELGKLDEAATAFQGALKHRPGWMPAILGLGNALRDLGKAEEAVACYRQACAAGLESIPVLLNLGELLRNLGRSEEAVASFRSALEQDPESVPALVNLGNVLRDLGRLEDAVASYRRGLALQPDFLGASNGLVVALADQGKLDEAFAANRAALAAHPGSAETYSSLLAFASYHHLLAPAEYLDLARGWERAVIGVDERRAARARCFRAGSLAGRRLRLGYVSGDFREHAVSFFIEQVFKHHNRDRVELFAYSNHDWSDTATARIRSHSEHWLQIDKMTDAAVRDRIEADRIDVLVNLSGHTALNRMGVFALRAAPVQAEYLGGLASSGLTEMDYWLGDAIVTPAESDSHFSERVWRLPRVWVSYEGRQDAPQPRRALQEDGAMRVGSFVNLKKLNPATFSLWARVLHALPEANLLLKSRDLADPGNRRRILDALSAHGVAPDRVELRDTSATSGWSSHMAYYDRLDVALDPIDTHSGATTTCDALWMGVPVVTRPGDRMGSRMTAALLAPLGCSEWIAQSDEEYVARVVALARDPGRRGMLRLGLRDQVARSSLCDASGLATCLEDAYAEMVERVPARQQVPRKSA